VNPENYRIKDLVEFEVNLEERKADGTFVPFSTNDLQLEFIRLDPFHRVFLKQDGSSSNYKVTIAVPDTLGIYKFKISHRRYGYTLLEEETLVSCIQFRHDEYPRFLNVAMPYYLNVFLLMGAGFLFIVFFLYTEVEKSQKKGQ
jgi:oligosaccharyltransferase complex subunit beta